MKVLRQSSIQSKTISTSPSFLALSNPAVHSYHQYQSLLRYVTSFMADLRLNIVQLKQIVYRLIGVDMNTCNYDCSASSIHCQQCEIQFMISNCRKAREDIFRITSLLRGYTYALHSGSTQLLNAESQRYQNQQVYYKESEQILENYKISNQQQSCFEQSQQHKQFKDIGFLTFRQNLNDEKQYKKYALETMIEEENLQQSHSSLIENSITPNQNHKNDIKEVTIAEKQEQSTNYKQSNTSIEQEFKKVLKLINLLRKQVNQCQQKQTIMQTKIQSAQIKHKIESTPTQTNDSPRNNFQFEQV